MPRAWSGLRYAMVRRRLPIGLQTFRKLREQDCYYVDKTAYIERLLDEGTHYFLSRPRRFRQEPVPGHAEGAVRGQRGTVRGALHPPAPQLVGSPSGGAAGLRPRPLWRAGAAGSRRHGAARRGRAAYGRGNRVPYGRGPLRVSSGSPARADRPAGGGAGGRVRQADPGRAGEAGSGVRQPRLPARAIRDDQVERRARGGSRS